MSDALYHPELEALLRSTSRSFYLTLRLLPKRIRSQIGLAYLLARTTDTIADTDAVPVEQRLHVLGAFRDRILGRRTSPVDLQAFLKNGSSQAVQASKSEQQLLLRLEEAIAALAQCLPEDQQKIREVLDTITQGQELDLIRFGSAQADRIVALQTIEETEDYTFRVAGCVGLFWTKMCGAHLFESGGWDESIQLRDGVRFGKGLQWVNILRDMPRDLRQGRCYAPVSDLSRHGLEVRDLLNPSPDPRKQACLSEWIQRAEDHLQAGWAYTQRIPKKQHRLRVACALPILIGLRTLALLRSENPWDPSRRIKVDRKMVRQSLVRALFSSWGWQAWDRNYQWALAHPRLKTGQSVPS